MYQNLAMPPEGLPPLDEALPERQQVATKYFFSSLLSLREPMFIMSIPDLRHIF